MISVIDGSPRGYDFAITVERFENTRQCPEIIPPYQRDKLSADSFPAREGSHVGISKVFSIHKPRPMLHNFPPLPPNYDGTILIEMPGRNVDIAALSRLTVLLQLVVWARAGTPARGLFLVVTLRDYRIYRGLSTS